MSIIAKVKDIKKWQRNSFYHTYHINSTMHLYVEQHITYSWSHTLDIREHSPVRPWFANMTEVMREGYAYALFYARTPKGIV